MPRLYAHRGFSGAYPENTLLGFQKALDLGVDGIELDVHVTADRIPVVIHDRSLERTTNGFGNVDELFLADLLTLDAGTGERVPTLADVLELVADRAHLDIEVKGIGIEREVLAVLSKRPAVSWAISSFHWPTLRRIRALSRQAELWPLADSVEAGLFSVVGELGSPAVSLAADAYTSESARVLRDRGCDVVVWTVNEIAEAQRVTGLGAAAICTDVPNILAQALSIAG